MILKISENYRPSASNFQKRSLEQFFDPVGQNNFKNKIPIRRECFRVFFQKIVSIYFFSNIDKKAIIFIKWFFGYFFVLVKFYNILKVHLIKKKPERCIYFYWSLYLRNLFGFFLLKRTEKVLL